MATKAMFDANNSTISIARELVEGEAPITSEALVLEPNSIDAFGNSVESTTRNPLSTSRDAKKGTVTSLNSTVELSQDLTISAYEEMMPAALSANWVGVNNNVIEGKSIYDVTKKNTHWEFKVKKPLYYLPTTAKLITSGFLDERRNGELEIENVDNGYIFIKNAQEHGFLGDNFENVLDPNGRITVEWGDIVPKGVTSHSGELLLDIPDGVAKTLEIGAKAILDGFAVEDNNREYTIIGISTANNTLKLYPEPKAESSGTQITIPGNTFDIYAGALTGDNAQTVDVTISAAGTYKITIGSITSTTSGSQTIQIQANGTDIVNEAREFSSAGATLNTLEFTHTKMAGQEQITTITLAGANLSATDVVITYKEDDKTKPADRKMYVSMEFKNWTNFMGYVLPYSHLYVQDKLICLFSGYNNTNNNGIKTFISDDATQDYFLFKSTVPMIDENVDYTKSLPNIKCVGLSIDKETKINIDKSGNLKIDKSLLLFFNAIGLMLKGSAIWIGAFTPEAQFEDEHANGIARIKNVDTNNGILYLDKRHIPEEADSTNYVFTPDTEEQLENKEIPLIFGQFLRTYPVGNKNYKRISHTVELKTTNDAGVSYYEYSVGNLTNTLELGLPSQEKSTLNVAYMSRKALDAVTTPLDWNRKQPKFNKVMSTPSDVLRCRVSKLDESGLATIWTDATLNINNNVGQEYAIGNLAPVSVSQGNLEITLAGNVFFDSPEVMSAITNNCTVSADIFLTNEDGGIFIDIPSATLSDGNRDFTNNEKIKQALTVTAYLEEEWNYSLSTTLFPYLPSDKKDVCG